MKDYPTWQGRYVYERNVNIQMNKPYQFLVQIPSILKLYMKLFTLYISNLFSLSSHEKLQCYRSKSKFSLNGIDFCLVLEMFANNLKNWGSIPGRVIPKTKKKVCDASLLNTQHYKVCIKGKVEQSRE